MENMQEGKSRFCVFTEKEQKPIKSTTSDEIGFLKSFRRYYVVQFSGYKLSWINTFKEERARELASSYGFFSKRREKQTKRLRQSFVESNKHYPSQKFLCLLSFQRKYGVSTINAEGPPVPIPNTEVKLCSGENTLRETAREDSTALTQTDGEGRMRILRFSWGFEIRDKNPMGV